MGEAQLGSDDDQRVKLLGVLECVLECNYLEPLVPLYKLISSRSVDTIARRKGPET